MPEDTTLDYLVRSLNRAKTDENKLKAHRIAVEEKIAALVPGPERGSKTVTLSDGTKVTVERGFNYKADLDEIAKLMTDPSTPPPIKVKTTKELDVSGYEWYKDNQPTLFGALAQFVVATPKKTSVTIKAEK